MECASVAEDGDGGGRMATPAASGQGSVEPREGVRMRIASAGEGAGSGLAPHAWPAQGTCAGAARRGGDLFREEPTQCPLRNPLLKASLRWAYVS